MSIDFRRLRDQIQIEELLRWMSWVPTQRRGDQLRGLCPFCQLPSNDLPTGSHRCLAPCFSVNSRRHIFRCFRCNRSGDVFKLWAFYRGIEIYPAAREIQNRLTPSAQPRIKQPTNTSKPASKQATAQPATPPNWLNS